MKYLSGAPIKGRFLALLTNIGLGWRGLPGERTILLGTFKNRAIKVLEHYLLVRYLEVRPEAYSREEYLKVAPFRKGFRLTSKY